MASQGRALLRSARLSLGSVVAVACFVWVGRALRSAPYRKARARLMARSIARFGRASWPALFSKLRLNYGGQVLERLGSTAAVRPRLSSNRCSTGTVSQFTVIVDCHFAKKTSENTLEICRARRASQKITRIWCARWAKLTLKTGQKLPVSNHVPAGPNQKFPVALLP